MVAVFKKREKTERITLPRVAPVIYHPLNALDRSSQHIHTTSESTHKTMSAADLATKIAKNISELKLDAAPLSSRFARMLEQAV